MLCVICMLYDYIDRTGGSNDTELEGSAKTHRPEGHIVALSGVCGILGNSLSFVLIVFSLVSGTSSAKGKEPAR